jgi:hypothetical protein
MLDREEQYQRGKIEKVKEQLVYNDEMQEKFIKDLRSAGEPLAKIIKEAFFNDVPWTPKIAFAVGHKMTEFKKMMRPMYKDVDDIQLLKVLSGLSAKEIVDIYADVTMTMEVICKEDQRELTGNQQGHSGRHIMGYMETPLLP